MCQRIVLSQPKHSNPVWCWNLQFTDRPHCMFVLCRRHVQRKHGLRLADCVPELRRWEVRHGNRLHGGEPVLRLRPRHLRQQHWPGRAVPVHQLRRRHVRRQQRPERAVPVHRLPRRQLLRGRGDGPDGVWGGVLQSESEIHQQRRVSDLHGGELLWEWELGADSVWCGDLQSIHWEKRHYGLFDLPKSHPSQQVLLRRCGTVRGSRLDIGGRSLPELLHSPNV